MTNSPVINISMRHFNVMILLNHNNLQFNSEIKNNEYIYISVYIYDIFKILIWKFISFNIPHSIKPVTHVHFYNLQ